MRTSDFNDLFCFAGQRGGQHGTFIAPVAPPPVHALSVRLANQSPSIVILWPIAVCPNPFARIDKESPPQTRRDFLWYKFGHTRHFEDSLAALPPSDLMKISVSICIKTT